MIKSVMNKRAMSHHIEMMISFVLFIMFVFFVLIFLKPQDNNYLSTSVVDGAFYNFLDNVRIDVMVLFVNVSDYDGQLDSCFELSLPVELVGSGEKYPISVVAFNREFRDSKITANTLRVKETENNSYYVFISDSFDDSDVSCSNRRVIAEPDIGSFRKEKMISYKKMELLKQEYYADYEGLRSKLGIPEVFDFAILMGDDFKMERSPAVNVDVLARDFIEKVIYEDGQTKYERITLKVWR